MTNNEKIEKKEKLLLKIFSKYKYADLSKGQHDKLNKLARHVLAAEIETKMDCLRSINFEFTLKIYNQVKELEQQLLEYKQ